MNILSLYDGISCGQLALGRSGIQVDNYFASEIDKYAIKVAQNNFPNTIQLGNVFDIKYETLPKIDLVIGGFPCTNISIAKRNREVNLNGSAGELFNQCLVALERCKPKYFLFENNYSIHKDVKDEVSRLLGVEPIMINSSLLSAQNRKRLYWTNIPNITQPKNKGIILQDILEEGITERDKSFCIDAIYYKGGNLKSHFEKHRRTQVFETVRLGDIGKGGQGQRIYSIEGKSVSLTANGGGQGAKTGLYKIELPDGDYFIRKLTPKECCRLQTLPDNYFKDTNGNDIISNTQQYKCIGNGWTVNVIAHILNNMERTVV